MSVIGLTVYSDLHVWCVMGIDESLAEEYFVSHWEDDTMSRNEILGHVGRAYKREYGNFGTLDFKILKW